jgi:hypothetical protein
MRGRSLGRALRGAGIGRSGRADGGRAGIEPLLLLVAAGLRTGRVERAPRVAGVERPGRADRPADREVGRFEEGRR